MRTVLHAVRPALLAALLPLLAARADTAPAAPDTCHFGGAGRLRLLSLEGRPVPLHGELRIAGPDWRFHGAADPWTVSGVVFSATGGVAAWRGRIPLEHGGRVFYEQEVRPRPGGAALRLTATAENDFPGAGVYYFIQLPVRPFSEAQVQLLRGTVTVAAAATPDVREPEKDPRFLSAPAVDGVRLDSAVERFRVALTFDRPRPVFVQDDRDWGSPSYSLVIQMAPGPQLRRGSSSRLELVVAAEGHPFNEPAEVSVGEAARDRIFEGFGGNFVYGLDGPVATALVDRLPPARARIEMPLHAWEPVNDNGSAAEADAAYFEARDAPGTELRRGFELAKRLADLGTPLVISVWDLPEWMYEGPPRGRWASRRTVAPALWPEVVESAAAYLLHLKKGYGVEPELFSFNEPEMGVRVLFTAEQHREAIRRFGERFAALGLKTRLLLGDVAEPRGTEGFGVYALTDPAAARHVGAVAFHSWGGATPAEYAAWSAMARRFGLPLDVTELGWDASSWRIPHDLETSFYAVQEARMILEVLAHARPRSALYWEYTDDYPLLVPGEGGALRETLRFRVAEQLVRLTPRKAAFASVSSSRPEVAAAAFRTGAGGAVLHLVNYGAARQVRVRGLPAGKAARAEVLPLAGGAPAARRIEPREGAVELELPAWSLATLTVE